jgi:phage terminase large subunit
VLCWVWVEEAFEIPREADFDKLDLSVPRGEVPPPLFKQTTLTFNPWNENHWLKARFFDRSDPQVFAITTDYRCNEFLDDTDRARYEQMRLNNPRQYAVAGLGQWGHSEGLVFENWSVETFSLQELRRAGLRHVFGLDYGYANDPTAFIAAAVDEQNKCIYLYDEHYETKMLNGDIAAMITRKGYQKERIRADSAEPKSNDDLRRLGICRIQAARKGADSVNAGIARLQEYRLIVHERCVHTAAELGAYCWQSGVREGSFINRPVDRDNHLMDALRYAMEDAPRTVAKEKPRRYGFGGGWSP